MNIEKIRPDTGITVFLVLASISLGFACFFVLDKDLFLRMEIIKLSVLSLAISSVVMIANALILFLFLPEEQETMADSKFVNRVMFIACAEAVLILGSALLFFDIKTNPVLTISVVWLVVFFINMMSIVSNAIRKNKSAKLPN